MTGSNARTSRSTHCAIVSDRLVCQTSARNGGRLRSAPKRARKVCGVGAEPDPAAPASGGARPPIE